MALGPFIWSLRWLLWAYFNLLYWNYIRSKVWGLRWIYFNLLYRNYIQNKVYIVSKQFFKENQIWKSICAHECPTVHTNTPLEPIFKKSIFILITEILWFPFYFYLLETLTLDEGNQSDKKIGLHVIGINFLKLNLE